MTIKALATVLFSLALANAAHAGPRTISGQIFIVTNGQSTIRLPLVEVFAISEGEYSRFLKAMTQEINARRDKQAQDLVSMKEELSAIETDPEKLKHIDLIQERAEFAERCRQRGSNAYVACLNSPEKQEINQKLEEQTQRIAPIMARYRELTAIFVRIRDDYKNSVSPTIFFDTIESTSKVVGTAKTDPDGKFSIKTAGNEIWLIARAGRQVFNGKESYRWVVKVPKGTNSIMLSNDNMIDTRCLKCASVPSEIVSHPEVSALF